VETSQAAQHGEWTHNQSSIDNAGRPQVTGNHLLSRKYGVCGTGDLIHEPRGRGACIVLHVLKITCTSLSAWNLTLEFGLNIKSHEWKACARLMLGLIVCNEGALLNWNMCWIFPIVAFLLKKRTFWKLAVPPSLVLKPSLLGWIAGIHAWTRSSSKRSVP
jgi:hypothetical protein